MSYLRRYGHHVLGFGSGLFMMLMLTALPSPAQERVTIEIAVLPPTEAIALLESPDQRVLNSAVTVIAAAFRENATAYSPAERLALLDGLESLVRGVRAEERSERSIRAAFAILQILALDPGIQAVERQQIPGRLMRIYHRSTVPIVQTMAVYNLGEVLAQTPVEAPAIGRVLMTIAQSRPSTAGVPPRVGLDALVQAGNAGVPFLRRLFEEGNVEDPDVRAFLAEHARKGYPVKGRAGEG